MHTDSVDSSRSRVDVLKNLIGRLTRPEITLAEARLVREEMARLLDLGAARPASEADPLGPRSLGPVA